jgi:hypothetical protein
MEAYRFPDDVLPRPDEPTPDITSGHTHLNFKTYGPERQGRSYAVNPNLTIAIPSLTTEQIRIYARQLRLILKAHARQTSRTPAWQRTHSKARRAGMRRTRRMMRA